MSEQTIKCPICGDPYVFYPHMAGGQSATPVDVIGLVFIVGIFVVLVIGVFLLRSKD